MKYLLLSLVILLGMSIQPADAQDSWNVQQLGSISYWDRAESVTVVDTLAYVAASLSGLRIVSIADPANPVEIGFCDTPGYACCVAVMGNYAYVADRYHWDVDTVSGLRVINITERDYQRYA